MSYSLINSKGREKACNRIKRTGNIGKICLFSYLSAFGMKTVLFQCRILTIGITSRVLSIGNIKNGGKFVQRGQKLGPLLKSVEVP